MSINKKSNRIDLDAGDILYHVKVNSATGRMNHTMHLRVNETQRFPRRIQAKSHELFYIWVTKLQAHRLFKKSEAAHVHCVFLHGSVAERAQANGDLTTVSCRPFKAHSNACRAGVRLIALCPQSSAGRADSAAASDVLPAADAAVNSKVSAWLRQSHEADTCGRGAPRLRVRVRSRAGPLRFSVVFCQS